MLMIGIGLAGACSAALAAMVAPPTDTRATILLCFVIGLSAAVGAIGLRRLLRLASQIEHDLEEIVSVAEDVARGNLERSVRMTGMSTEQTRQLGTGVNAIAARVRNDTVETKRLERVRSEFIGNVSHELRTPIFSVQGYLETLLDGAVDDISVRDDFLRKAHHNVLRLHTLLTDLIEISRIESGEMRMSIRYFDIASFLRSIVEELMPTAEIAGIGLELRIMTGEPDVQVKGDRDRLKQVIVNLVENAIKYNRSDGSVSVVLETSPEGATISVSDTGIGIPPEDVGRIFERFYRVDRDRSRAVGGSGLGLSIVKHILEKHRARIRVSSTPGEGSTFSFTLQR